MSEEQLVDAVARINEFLREERLVDFEIANYNGYTLTLAGRHHSSAAREINIHFESVFFISLPMQWSCATSSPPLRLLMDEEWARVSRKFEVVYFYRSFCIAPEGFPEDFGRHVAAERISFEIIERNEHLKSAARTPSF